MRGVKSENLIAIVDFLYCGEANVYQENLDSFLAIAEELRLKGLMGQTENEEKKMGSTYEHPTSVQINSKLFCESVKSNTERRELNLEPPNTNKEYMVEVPHVDSGNLLQELDEKVKSMMETSQNLDSRGARGKICKLCGKEGQNVAIRDHIEAKHLEGISLPCNVCEKTFKSRMRLRQHKC